jgi:hypothetical protein
VFEKGPLKKRSRVTLKKVPGYFEKGFGVLGKGFGKRFWGFGKRFWEKVLGKSFGVLEKGPFEKRLLL